MVKMIDVVEMTSKDLLLTRLKQAIDTHVNYMNDGDEEQGSLYEMLAVQAFKYLVNQLTDNDVKLAKKHVIYVIFDKLNPNKAKILVSSEKRKNKKIELFTCDINGEKAFAY